MLRISLSNPDILDEIEEEACFDIGAAGEIAEDSPSIISDQMRASLEISKERPNSVDFSVKSRKCTDEIDRLRKEEERREKELMIEENGPFLEPGLVDYICVVGPNNVGDQTIDTGTRGWLGK